MEKNLMNIANDNYLQGQIKEQGSDVRRGIPLIQETCQIHNNSRLDYLCVDAEQNYVFKCMYCVTDDNINQLTLIPIEQILIADSKTVFANFPLKDRDLTREIKQIALSPPTGTAIKQSIDTFFKEFRAKLLDRIDSIQQKMVEKAQSISDFGEVLMTHYNRVSSKEHLKSIILDRQKSIENKTTEIKNICAETLSKDEENTQFFTGLINSIKTLEKTTDFETPKLISKSIFNQLDSINMFLVDDMAHLQQQLLNVELQQQKQLSSSDSITNLMKLVSNKLNEVSQDQIAQLEQQLNRYSFIIGQLPVPVPGQLYDNLEKFDSEEISAFTQLIKNYAQTKINPAGEQGFQEQQHSEEIENENKEKLSANQIIELIKNQTNFCVPEFIEDFSKVMTTIEGLLGLFKVRRSPHKSEEREAFNKLNSKQLENFTKLAVQVNMMTRNHGDQYLQSNSPQSNIQLNSNRATDFICNRFQIIGSQEERAQAKKDLDYLFVQYPILELLPPLKFFNPQPMTFTRTKYGNSSEMGITMNGNELELTFPNCAGKVGQAVSEILKNESGYLLRLKFNRPYGKHASGQFRIGLIPNSQIDSNNVLPGNNKIGFCSSQNSGATILTQGSRLSVEAVRSVTSEVEFRWCISKRQFFISDSTYSNINQAEEKYFNPTETYRFGVYFSVPEGDWKVTITDFQEIDPKAINNYS